MCFIKIISRVKKVCFSRVKKAKILLIGWECSDIIGKSKVTKFLKN